MSDWRHVTGWTAMLVVFLAAAAQLYVVYIGANLVEVSHGADGAHKAALSLQPGCMLNVLSQIAFNLSRAVARKKTKELLRRHQILLMRRGLLNGRGLALACVTTRCCRPIKEDLHRVLEEISSTLLVTLEPTVKPHLVGVLRHAAAEINRVIEGQAVGSGRLVVSHLVTEVVHSVLNLPELPGVVCTEVRTKLPDAVSAVVGPKLSQIVVTVWAALTAEFWAAPPREGESSYEAVWRARTSRLGAVLTRLVDDLVDGQVLAPVRRWYQGIFALYSAWFVCLLILFIVTTSLAGSLEVGSRTWTVCLGLTTLAALGGQVYFTFAYLVKRSEYLTEQALSVP